MYTKLELQRSLMGATSLFRDDDLQREYAIMATMLIQAIEMDLEIQRCTDPDFVSIIKLIPPITLSDMPIPPKAWSNLLIEDDDDITDELMYQWLSDDPRQNLHYFYMLFWAGHETHHIMWVVIFVRAWALRLIEAIHRTYTGQTLFEAGVILAERMRKNNEV